MESRNSNNLKGIDISNWKGNVDFSKVKNDGIEIVYMKASEGSDYKDKFLDQNYVGAKRNKLKVGFYHFFRGNTDPKIQAKHFVNCINSKKSDCRLAIDVETTDGASKSILTSMCIEFLEEVKRLTGKSVVVYTYTSFARDNIDNRLSIYPLWIAHYGVNTPGSNPIWNSWVGFQYSSEGRVNGVNGNCDMDEFTSEIFLNYNNNNIINANNGNFYFKIGDKVQILGNVYATGEIIPDWVKSKIYTIEQVSSNKALLKEILSWVYIKDLINVNFNQSKSMWKYYINGSIVKELQSELNRQFGKNLKVDGYFGEDTINALVIVRQDARGNITKIIQKRLIDLGYGNYLKSWMADGVFGTGTRNAVMQFQKYRGLSIDGIVGKETWKALFKK